MEVKLIRISSGEDVVAEFIEEREDVVVVKNAIVAIPTGNSKLGFAPWVPIIDRKNTEVEVKKNFIVFIANPDEAVVEQYEQMFSVIAKPENKKLIL